jgi:hypothetical protein
MSSSLDAIKESLQRRVDLISKLDNEGDLYLETCNYMNAIVSDQRTNPIVQSILTERDCLFKNHKKLEDKATKKLLKISHSVRELLSNAIDSKEIDALFTDFDGFASNRAWISGRRTWESLENSLRTICWKIKESKNIKIDGVFTVKNNLVQFNSADEKLFAKCHEEWESIKTAEQTVVWGAWNRLVRVYKAVYGTKRDCQEALKKDIFAGSGFVNDVNEMKKIIGNSSALKQLSLIPESKNAHFNQKLVLIDLERLHNFILDRFNRTSLGLALLTKYKRRCEWYDREEMLRKTEELDEQKRDAVEKELARKLCMYLLDNNVLPLSEVALGRSRPDVLIQSKEELFPVEVKVVRINENDRVKKGFNQIVTYIRTIDASEGFYVIFCRGDFALQIPQTIFDGTFRINIVTVGLPETSPSTRKAKVWKIAQNDLLSS